MWAAMPAAPAQEDTLPHNRPLPRLAELLRAAAGFSPTEAADCLRSHRTGDGFGSEALNVAGGSRQAIGKAFALRRRYRDRLAYLADVRRCATYHDGTPRLPWEGLPSYARASWTKNPTPRDYAPAAPLFADQGTGRRPDNAAQLIALRAAAPLRPPAGRTDDLDGLALFDVDRSPRLI